MATDFPGAIDDFTPDPTPTDPRNAPSLAGKITDLSDSVVAVETAVGTTGSADTNSLQYRVSAITNVLLDGAGAPAGGLGVNGNYYLNTTNGAIYEKSGGVWSAIYTPSAPTDPTTPLASDFGFKAWTGDPVTTDGSGAAAFMTSGSMYVSPMIIRTAGTISNAYICGASAGTPTNAFFALYTSAGALVAQTANRSATVGTIGLSAHPFTAPYAAAAGLYYLGFWMQGTLASPNQHNRNHAGWIVAMPNGVRRFSIANTGLTNTVPGTLGAQTDSTAWPWMAVS